LVGYITDGVVFNTNATDVSISATNTWTDLPALPDDAVMGIYEIISTSDTYRGSIRGKGDSIPLEFYARRHPWAAVDCDDDRIVQGYISNTAVDFFLIGYATGDEEDTFIPSIIVT
jgi:hypothetical protein